MAKCLSEHAYYKGVVVLPIPGYIFFIFCTEAFFLKMPVNYVEKDHKATKSIATPFFQKQRIKTPENDNGLF